MSTASSTYETRVVNLLGEDLTIEQALTKIVRMSQEALNNVEANLRQLSMLEDQCLDEDEDFKLAVKYEDDIVDFIEKLQDYLDELPGIAASIRGDCPKASKQWFTAHKLKRKAEKIAEKQRIKDLASAAKALSISQ